MSLVEVGFKGWISLKIRKHYLFVCTSQPQSTYKSMPLWNRYTTELDRMAY